MKLKEFDKGEVIIYKPSKGDVHLDVKLTDETVWLNINQMVQLFKRDKSVISRHISGVYAEKELVKNSTVAKFATVQKEGDRLITRNIEYYNLDVIISIGYRVKSKEGTQFRIWANKILKEYLVKGYALNEKMLNDQTERLKEIEQFVKISKRLTENKKLEQDEFAGILDVLSDYTLALDILDQYDHQNLKLIKSEVREEYIITYEDSIELIEKLKGKFGGSKLFGKTKDESFRGTIGAIYQTFNKK